MFQNLLQWVTQMSNIHHNSFYSAFDRDFGDQEQCSWLFHTWDLQINMLLVATQPKDKWAETTENDYTNSYQAIFQRERVTIGVCKGGEGEAKILVSATTYGNV